MEACDKEKIIQDVSWIRKRILKLAKNAGANGSHLGGSLSIVEVLAVLYSIIERGAILENRDRFILSKGHGALALYCMLEKKGLLTKEETDTFESNGTDFFAHAKRNIEKGIEFSGGSLSLGISFAIGVALACKSKGINNHVYVLVGDGECNEGLLWESIMAAANFQLNNLTVIVDCNSLQSDGFTKDIMNLSSLAKKFTSFGFNTIEIDGHSIDQLYESLSSISTLAPKAIIARTVKGKGVSFMENERSWHHGILTDKLYEQALSELE